VSGAAHSVLFVCLGNICRSPTAEAVFRHQVEAAGLGGRIAVDSCGTAAYHVGEPPDARSQQAAARRGYDLSALRARQFRAENFLRFGWILAMDRSNLAELEALRPTQWDGHLGLLLGLDPHSVREDVPDPYYGGGRGFEDVLDLLEAAGAALLERIRKQCALD